MAMCCGLIPSACCHIAKQDQIMNNKVPYENTTWKTDIMVSKPIHLALKIAMSAGVNLIPLLIVHRF